MHTERLPSSARAIREMGDPVAEHHVGSETRTLVRWDGEFLLVTGSTVTEAVEAFPYDQNGRRVLDAAIAVFDREAWEEVMPAAREAA